MKSKKHTTAKNIFKPGLFDQNLSHKTNSKIPKAKHKIAPNTWATIGAILGAQCTKVIHNRPKPKATKELQRRVCLKLS